MLKRLGYRFAEALFLNLEISDVKLGSLKMFPKESYLTLGLCLLVN